MLQQVFTVYDQKADAYLPPWIMPKAVMAQRVFGDCVNSKDHQFNAHPDDYTLFMLGDWNDETGEFRQLPQGKRSLGNGLEYLKSVNSGDQMELIEATEGQPDVVTETARIQPGTEGGDSKE